MANSMITGIITTPSVRAVVTEVFASFVDNSTIRFPTIWIDKPEVITLWTDKG